MRSISTRFLLTAGIFALAFSGIILYRTWTVTRDNSDEQTARVASLALEFDLAIRAYVGDQVRPEMVKRIGADEFYPETMSTSYVARSIFEEVRKRFPGYVIKFSSANPRNPANMAGPEELRGDRVLQAAPRGRAIVGPGSHRGEGVSGLFQRAAYGAELPAVSRGTGGRAGVHGSALWTGGGFSSVGGGCGARYGGDPDGLGGCPAAKRSHRTDRDHGGDASPVVGVHVLGVSDDGRTPACGDRGSLPACG